MKPANKDETLIIDADDTLWENNDSEMKVIDLQWTRRSVPAPTAEDLDGGQQPCLRWEPRT